MSHYEFKKAYSQILTFANKHEIAKGHNNEVVAYLCFLTFAVLDEEAVEHIPISPNEFMYNRLRLYSGLTPSTVLNNWMCPNIPNMEDNPLILAFIAFGDLLINRDARKDYHSAPHVLHGFSDTVLFSATMLKVILPITNDYIEYLISVKEGKDQPLLHKNKNAQHNSKSDLHKTIIGLLCLVGFLLLICYFVFQSQNSENTSSNQNRNTTGNPYTNSQYYDFLNMSKATATPRPAVVYNGRKFITPDYSSVCPFEVMAGSDGDYYIYLKYQKAPTYSQVSRKRLSAATAPYEADIAFFVKADQSIEIDVPIGVYKLYYATGDTFYNTSILFGDTTQCYESDDLLTFNASNNYYNGHTITLYKVSNGNLDTDKITEKSFPTR